MIRIISGTNRHKSISRLVANQVKSHYDGINEPVEILDLAEMPLLFAEEHNYVKSQPDEIKEFIQKVNTADGLVIVCPEYNGSYPGALKYFIDHWAFPTSFEWRPVCFIGLGGRFGGLRPVEHLQQVFGYRNSFIYPQRVFLIGVTELMKQGEVKDPAVLQLMKQQASGFQSFVRALKTARLDANSILSQNKS